jgi:uncharacterized membrane protein YbhN (UPF0104 family)
LPTPVARRLPPFLVWGTRVAAAGLLAYLGLRLWELWRANELSFSTAEPSLLVVAAIASLIAVVAYGCVWPVILRLLGAPVPRDALGIFLKSQLGKYLPGSVWHYAGRAAMARTRGVPVATTMASLGIEVVASALAAGLVSALVVPPLASLGLATGLIALVLLFPWLASVTTRLRPELRTLHLAGRIVPPAMVLYLPVWAAYGAALWLTARAFFPLAVEELPFFVGAFALGWLAGLVVVVAPGGIGIREAVLVALLGPRIGTAEAIVVAGTSRVLLTGADFFAGAFAMAWTRRAKSHLVDPFLRTGVERTTS